MLLDVLYLNTKLASYLGILHLRDQQFSVGRAEWSRKGVPGHLLCWAEHVPLELFCLDLNRSNEITRHKLRWWSYFPLDTLLGCKYSARTRCLVVWFLQGWRSSVACPDWGVSPGGGQFSWETESGQACVRTVVPSQASIWAKLFLRIYCFTANPGRRLESKI